MLIQIVNSYLYWILKIWMPVLFEQNPSLFATIYARTTINHWLRYSQYIVHVLYLKYM